MQVNRYVEYSNLMYRTTVQRLQKSDLLSDEFIEPLNYVAKIWQSCVFDTTHTNDHMVKLNEYFKQLDKLDSWQSKFVKLTNDGYNVLFSVEMGREAGIHVYQLFIDSPKLELADLYSTEASSPLLEYYASLVKLLKKKDDLQLAKDIIDFDHWLWTNATSAGEKKKFFNNRMMQIEEINQLTKMKWHELLSKFVPSMFSGQEDEQVNVLDLKYLENFRKLIDSKDDAFLSDYFKVAVIQQSCFVMGQECRRSHLKMLGVEEERKPSQVHQMCFQTLQKLELEDLMYAAYETRERVPYSRPDLERNNLEVIIKQLTVEFKNLISNFTWMDEYTKNRTIAVFRSIIRDEATPVYVSFNNSLIRKHQSAPHIDSTEDVAIFDYFKDILAQNKQEDFAMYLRSLIHKWPISFFSALPYFSPVSDRFYIPEYFVTGPLAAVDLPGPLKFGYFGSPLAHEMVHAFDETAFHLRKELFDSPLWSNWTKDRYKDKAKCLIDAYNGQEVAGTVKINGTSTLQENLADWISVDVAHAAVNFNS